MNDEELMLGDSGVDAAQAGASSTEDFWMFFSFAMILLVFVLMNYVNYLYSMVVKVEKEELESQPTETVETAQQTETSVEIRIYVKRDGGGVFYTFADGEDERLNLEALTAGLADRVRAPGGGRELTVYVHSPGDVLYQQVFDASFAAWALAERNPGLDMSVSLVYQER